MITQKPGISFSYSEHVKHKLMTTMLTLKRGRISAPARSTRHYVLFRKAIIIAHNYSHK